MRNFFLYILTVVLLLKIQVLTTGCANIIPPEGGFRDSVPPVLLKADPPDSSRNFSETRINFSFDEYVQIDNFQQNAIISPIPRNMPTVTYRLNTISLRLKDTLEPSTTYSVNFGNSIKDVNESNLMKDFTYIFSTGPSIDSLSFRGKVLLAESGKTDSTLIIILHTSSKDSAVVNERPRYMTKSDGQGNFIFRNLPADTFYVYALKDDARSFRYLNPRQLFAFADSQVVVQQNTASKTLYAYQLVKTGQTISTSVVPRTTEEKRLKFQTTIASNKTHDLLKKFSFLFERPLRQFDSSKIRLATDTIYTPVNNYTWSADSAKKKITLNYSLQENTLYHLILEKDFATDTLGQQLLKGDTLSFTTLKNEDYANLSIRFRNLDFSKYPVLQFVQADAVVNSFPLTAETFSQTLFLPGEYELRILNDTNKNGIWDPGEFFGKHQQPEIVRPIERRINIKVNSENDFELSISN